MKPGDRVVLELTHEQAVVVEKAAELLFRLHIGQFNEIKWALRQHVMETGVNVDSEAINATLDTLPHLFFPELRMNESFNVQCCEECNVAYNVYQAIRYVNAWHQNPKGSIGVAFDPPHHTGVPIPKCYLVKEGEASENDD